jgi:hypothetical protein
MSISQNFPNTRPSLNLNFARSQTLDPRITFTRTTSGTRVGPDGYIEVIPADQPRFDFDPVTGECLGLLVEEQRTNLITITTNNENGLPITDFNYPMSGFDENNTELDIAPDGNLVLCKYDLAGTNGPFLSITSTASITAGVTYTMSMWVKGGSSYSASFAWVNQTTNEVPNTTISITPEWRRYTFSFTPQFNSTSSRLQIFFSTQGNDKIISVWGAQLEQGSFATSYIPRPSGQATRTADNASITGSNFTEWYNPSEGTLISQSTMPLDRIIPGSFRSFAQIVKSSSYNSDSIFQYINSGNSYPASEARVSNSNVFGITSGNTYFLGCKIATAYAAANYAISSAGVAPVTNSYNGVPNDLDKLCIGNVNDNNSLGCVNGTISQLTYYPTRLPNAQLQTLTK